MDWWRENWFWIVVLVLFALMHMGHGHGGHGRHGGHGGHGKGGGAQDGDRDESEREPDHGGHHAQH